MAARPHAPKAAAAAVVVASKEPTQRKTRRRSRDALCVAAALFWRIDYRHTHIHTYDSDRCLYSRRRRGVFIGCGGVLY